MSSHLQVKAGDYIFDDAYELVCTLGRGSDSIIYKARPLQTLSEEILVNRGTTYIPRLPVAAASKEFLAVKVLTNLSKNPARSIARIRKEAAALNSAASKHVIQLVDVVAREDLCYIALEYAPHGNLQELLKKYSQPLPPERALKLILQLLEGLEAVHDGGILHRDVKPENLLVTDRQTIKLCDFSVALLPQEREDSSFRSALGTLDYAAPELLSSGNGDESSDLYSSAITLFELITRALPFSGDSLTEQLNRKLTGVRTPLDRFVDFDTSDFEKFFDRALAPDPLRRFNSAAEMRGWVEQLIQRKVYQKKRFTTVGTARSAAVAVPIEPKTEIRNIERRSTQIDTLHQQIRNPRRTVSRLQHRATAMFHTRKRTKWALSASIAGLLLAVGFGTSIFGRTESALASISTPNLTEAHPQTRSFGDGIRQLFTSKTEPYTVVRSLTAGTHVGILRSFLGDAVDLPVIVQGVELGKRFSVTLGIPGWSSKTILLAPDSGSTELLIVGHGMSFSLWLDPQSLSEGRLAGVYREHASGREGAWELKRPAENL